MSARTPEDWTCSQTRARASTTSGDSEFAGGLTSQAIAISPRVSSLTGPSPKPSSGRGHGKKPWPAFWPSRPCVTSRRRIAGGAKRSP